MGRQLVAQVARGRAAALGHLLALAQQFSGEVVNLLLLAINGEIELIEQIFGVAGLDLQIVQALFEGGGILHGAIGTQSGNGMEESHLQRNPRARGSAAAYRPSSG